MSDDSTDPRRSRIQLPGEKGRVSFDAKTILAVGSLLVTLAGGVSGYAMLQADVRYQRVEMQRVEMQCHARLNRLDEDIRRTDTDVRGAITKLQVGVARICAKLGADCRE